MCIVLTLGVAHNVEVQRHSCDAASNDVNTSCFACITLKCLTYIKSNSTVSVELVTQSQNVHTASGIVFNASLNSFPTIQAVTWTNPLETSGIIHSRTCEICHSCLLLVSGSFLRNLTGQIRQFIQHSLTFGRQYV